MKLAVSLMVCLGGMLWHLQPPATEPQQIPLHGHVFTLPPGFTIELVAGPPLVDRPIAGCFDEQGRLYVTEASGTNAPVQEQLRDRPHRVLRLEDTDGDGKFDKRTVFADKLMLPQGVLWHEGSLYIAAAPSIWKLTDTDGDGVADQRVEWFQGKTLTGCANDLHGPYAGPDGWLYWCKGAFAKQTYERPGKPPLVTRAAHIFRARPDGTGIEPVMTGGMDNPVEVAFLPTGERFFTTTFLQHPAGGKRDGILHAIYGGIHGKDHDPIHEHPWTGPTLLPVMTHLGPAAPSGLACYESTAFGPEYRHNLFASLFNMHKVTRHVLEPHGATFTTRDEDFLVSNNIDFHPTDVFEDADGSLLVIDTGGWYKLCCPTSQFPRPEVLGGIYRIRKTGSPKHADPRGLRLAWDQLRPEELAAMLGHPLPAYRQRAVAILAMHGAAALPTLERVLRTEKNAQSRLDAVWAAIRMEEKAAGSLVRTALQDESTEVRQAALHGASLWRDGKSQTALQAHLHRGTPVERRMAAEALGRFGDAKTVPNLLAAAGRTTDPIVRHAAIYALIEIHDAGRTAEGLQHADPQVRRAALIALDQMPGRNLQAAAVLGELSAGDTLLKEAAWWIVGRHPEWGAEIAKTLRPRFAQAADHSDLLRYLPGLAGNAEIQDLLADLLRPEQAAQETKVLALQIMAQASPRQIPPAWRNAVLPLLTPAAGQVLPQAVATVRSWPLRREQAGDLIPLLSALGRDEKQPPLLRLQALAAVPGGLGEVQPPLFVWLCRQAGPDQPVAERALAAEVLSRSRLTTTQLLKLADFLQTWGPMELDRVLAAFAQTREEKVGLRLLECLKASSALVSLRPDTLKATLAKYGPAVQQEAAALHAVLRMDAKQQQAHLEKLLASLQPGDISRGRAVFQGSKGVCISCHAIGYLGGKVGPDLTHIGRIRTERDLLEAIVYPNASFVRSYEPVVVLTRDGKIHNGVLRRDAADEVVVAVNADQEVRLPRTEIEEMKPSKVSLMPSGLEQQLTPQELADLVAFLKACK